MPTEKIAKNKLKRKLKDVPHKPGVYKFLGDKKQVLYVGKAKDLRNRVGQYFGTSDTRPQLPFLMAEAVDLDYVVVNTELESLFLENTLIKDHMPPYNIMLRDDRNYAFITIDYSTEIPHIGYARKINPKNKQVTYFGPYTAIHKIRKTLDFIRRVFPFCESTNVGKRACFYYHLHRCPGVCIGAVDLITYKQQLENIALFLSGKTGVTTKKLKRQMDTAAQNKNFELAARLRDQLRSVEMIEEKQLALFPKSVSWDFISLYIDGTTACVNLFKVRDGKLKDKENFIYANIAASLESENSTQAILQRFSETYYSQATNLPRSIYTQESLPNPELIQALLSTKLKYTPEITSPKRAKKKELITLGITNAKEYLRKWQSSQATSLDELQTILEDLQKLLNLPTLPRRIEGYDISNTQGTNPVGSMVVFEQGAPKKSEYRKFKITSKDSPDDFGMMQEMLERRLTRISPKNQKNAWPVPDLLVIDGGKGQLSSVVEILEKQNVKIPVISLAKRIEEIFLPGNSKPIILPHDNPMLQMLQRLRDEAHRFGITFHKSLRSKQAVKSALDNIPGIGPKTKKLLKQKIGTVAAIKRTPLPDLEKLVGKSKAKKIKTFL